MTGARPVILAVVLAVASCTGGADAGDPEAAFGSSGTRFDRAVCALPPQHLRLIRAGYHPARSGHIQIVPGRDNYFGSRSHSGPWPFLQRVPLLLFGPGHVPVVGSVDRPVTLADVAPTYARVLGFDLPDRDGRPLEEAVEAGGQPPRLIVTVVWDGGGRNVLEAYPDAWPTLRRLIDRGAWYERATVGSSPSVTPASHTTLGTGVFPRRHGLVDLVLPRGGEMANVRDVGPESLLVPTVADEYDRALGNRPKVGAVASAYALGMVGSGAALPGGDRDVAVTQDEDRWGLPASLRRSFRFPPSVRDVPGLRGELRRLDRRDGELDGRWLGVAVSDEAHRTPAFGAHQVRVLEDIIRTEGFGADDVPDLLYTNFKQIDLVGHRWGMDAPQMEAAVRSSDRALKDLIRVLDREVGEGRWVLALTADHGSMPDARVTGGVKIDPVALKAALQRRFDGDGDGRDAIRMLRVTQVWIDEEELAERGATLTDVARFLQRITEADLAAPASTPPSQGSRRPLFAAAFPSSAMVGLRCAST
ncbi:MAG: alkaline phosphatase family protein [Actinomycetota bacterium]